MRKWDILQLDDFLACNPKVRITEINEQRVVLAGEYRLKAKLEGGKSIDRVYQLKVIFPCDYPRKLPQVLDEEGYFPRIQEFHTYTDGSFCLGSELKMRMVLRADHSLKAFIEKIVDPFLYAVSHRIEYGNYPYGELAHGEQGLVDEYEGIMGVKGKASVLFALKALGKRRREANKLLCPCGCGLRLGRCKIRFRINLLRNIERRCWFRHHLEKSFTIVEHPGRALTKK